MKQQIKAVLDDERGVSPVIGVILMVAITVILAAVIGTFVLGLGDSLEQTPQATISVDADGTAGVDISHNGGDAIPAADLRVAGSGPTTTNLDNGFADQFSGYSGTDFSVGDTVSFDEGAGDYTIRIIHTPSQSILVEATVTV